MKRFLLLLVLVGCNLKPDYTRPEMDVGQTFRFLEGEDLSEYANVAWWKQFEDPGLDTLIETALQNNQNLQVATGRVLEFYARYKIAFSQFFPELDAQLNVDRLKLSQDINYAPPVPGVPRINDLYGFLFKLSYELDFWGKIRNATDAAKSIYLEQVYSRRNVILTLVSSVAAAYVLLKQYYSQLKISELTYESRKKSWDIALLRFDVGLVSELEVKQAESEALVAEVQIKNFELLIGKQEDLIGVLLGEAPKAVDQGVVLAELKLPPSMPVGLPSDLLAYRPDILQAEQNILAANAEVGVARAAFWPTFTLTGGWGQNSTDFKEFFDSSANLFRIGLQAFEPLFTGWRITNQLNEAEAVLYQALHAYQQTILNALQEVDDALIEHQKSKEKLAIQKNWVASLADYLRLAQLRYDNGQNDYLTVLDAEKSLFQAQLSQAATEGDLYLSLISLYKSLGQGWNVDPAYGELIDPIQSTDESESK